MIGLNFPSLYDMVMTQPRQHTVSPWNFLHPRQHSKGGISVRYRIISYKYSRKATPDAALQNMWESFGSWAVPSISVWRPPTDVYESPDELIVVMELAGVPEDNMAITLFSDLLVVEGTREQPALSDSAMTACHQLGIKYGEFRAEIYIPRSVDHDAVKAEYKNGLLKITLRKLD